MSLCACRIMRHLWSTLLVLVVVLPSWSADRIVVTAAADTAGPGRFAVAEILREAQARGLETGSDQDAQLHIELALGRPPTVATGPESYAIRVTATPTGRRYVVHGADAVGAMYGGLDLAEAIRTASLAEVRDGERRPHIEQRGIKFNIPLDLRTPSYSDPADAAQANIPEMWSMEFWREFLDDMARHRYNTLSLWNLHPFPSIVKVPEFPNVALSDVWRTTAKLDENFDFAGDNFVRPQMLAQHEVVKRLSIDDKIAFWRAVMELARDRGVSVYWFTWNVFLHGALGKDGLTEDETSARTIAYFRASVRETITTYPLLAGLGITAGESMPKNLGMPNSRWLWQTYGEGIRDGLKATPQRPFRLIHRFHWSGLGEIRTEFKDLPCTLDLSFKYSVAHMYSIPNPRFIEPLLPHLHPGLRSWLTVRNDDIYSFRWADWQYARDYIAAMPGRDKCPGFYMGPDGYTWGRDFLTRDVAGVRPTVMQKQWLSFSLWGRLAYDPTLPEATFHRLIAARFPGADVARLSTAWAESSRTFPLITRFFWGDIDLKWLPEACSRKTGGKAYFYTVRNFIEGGTMPHSGVRNIIEWRTAVLAKQPLEGVSPLAIADDLDANGVKALAAVPALRQGTVNNAAEYAATVQDIATMAHLARYYAAKIRGACDLALFDRTGDTAQQAAAVAHLSAALDHWQAYASAYTQQYVQPVLYNRIGVVDLPGLTTKAAADVQTAREWKPGTIDESKIKRMGTEKGFKP
jgi:hypothetical protein